MTRPSRATRVHVAVNVVCWAAAVWVIWISVRRGRELQITTPEIFLGAAPLVGRNFRDGWDWRFSWGWVAAGIVAIALTVSCWRGWWNSLRMRWVLVATALGSMAFAVMLALTDGADGLLYGAEHKTEYLANLKVTPPAGVFVRTFVARLHNYSVHVRGHPPGFVLVLKFLQWVGIGGGWTTAALSVLATGLVPVGVLVVTNSVAGNLWARRAAPFLIVSPYAIWMVTSADAVYAAVGALGTAAIAIGIWRRRWVAASCGLAGGLALGGLLFGTYLGVLLLAVPAAVLGYGLWRRAPGAIPALLGATLGGLAVVVGFLIAGFWWLDGARQTKLEYLAGSAQFRTWAYFGLANIAVALIAVGPSTLAGLLRLRDRRLWILIGASVGALVVSHVSRYTKAEVERIWLLFYPWIVVAGASLFVSRRSAEGGDSAPALQIRRHRGALWIGAQASCTIVLQAALVTKW